MFFLWRRICKYAGRRRGKRCWVPKIITIRIVTWTEEGIEIEGDPRHPELIIIEAGMDKSKGVDTPGVKERQIEK